MSFHLKIDDLPPDAIHESNNWVEGDDLLQADCGLEDGIPIYDSEQMEEHLIDDTVNVPNSPTIEQDLSTMILSTVVPNGGHIYGFKLIGNRTYEIHRHLNNIEAAPEDQWELREGTITLTGNLSLEIAFLNELKAKSKDRWTTVGIQENPKTNNVVLGILPKGAYNHE